MDLLLILTYTALCVAVFKVFKIPLNKWTVPTAVLGGVILIGTLILLMNYNHPLLSWEAKSIRLLRLCLEYEDGWWKFL